MNLNQLSYFLEIHRFGNFSKAAQHIGITQPALSLQIQKLEEELDFKLLDRTRKPLELTPEGRIFLEKATEIIHKVEHLKEISLELGEEVKGSLKVGIIPTLAPYLIPLFIRQLNERYPQLTLEISELKTEQIISLLKIGELTG